MQKVHVVCGKEDTHLTNSSKAGVFQQILCGTHFVTKIIGHAKEVPEWKEVAP